jgi:hypothetical protein
MTDAHMDTQEVERARLETEIIAVTSRIDTALQRRQEREAALRAAVEHSRAELAELERHHDRAVTMVRESADAEVERILSLARQHIAAQQFFESEPGDASGELQPLDGTRGGDDVE